jgi:nucleoid-associated protein YgaU
MRAVALLLFFAAAFGLAALWQSHRVEALKRERELAVRLEQGEIASSPSGLIESGWGVVVVGTPSGVAVPPRATAERNDGATPSAPPPVDTTPRPTEPRPEDQQLGDFELVVESGQTLSKIAKAHYGTAARDVVRALARYNGLADENELKLGQALKLPALDRLQR